MCLFVWRMITFTVLTFELLNSKSCYVELPVSSLIATSIYSSVPCYPSLLLRQEILSSVFVRQGRCPAIQAEGPVLSVALAPWTFCCSAPLNPTPVGRQLQHVDGHYEPQRPSPGGFWGQQELLPVQKGLVCWLLSCGEGSEPYAGEGCFSGWDLSLLRLESCIPSLKGKSHPGKKCIRELNASAFLYKFFSNRETCKPYVIHRLGVNYFFCHAAQAILSFWMVWKYEQLAFRLLFFSYTSDAHFPFFFIEQLTVDILLRQLLRTRVHRIQNYIFSLHFTRFSKGCIAHISISYYTCIVSSFHTFRAVCMGLVSKTYNYLASR